MSTKLPTLSTRCRGFTLIEVLVALTILTIAVLGIGVAVGVQSGGTAKSVSFGLGAVSRAGFLSTAAFRAQERLEQVKGFLVQNYTVNGAGVVTNPFAAAVGLDVAPPGFADDTPLPSFNRRVRVAAGPAGATTQVTQVTVTVTFNAPGDDGVHTESVAVSTLMAARQS